MYCPSCGNQNIKNAKFCRACGGDLETVSLAVSNKLSAPSYWLEQYSEGKSKVAGSAVMLGGAFLIWAVPAFFVRDIIGWSVLWAVFFGWLAIWGIFSMAGHVSSMVKAKTMLRGTGFYDRELPSGEIQQIPESQPHRFLDAKHTTSKLTSPPSVTEHTTKFLNEK